MGSASQKINVACEACHCVYNDEHKCTAGQIGIVGAGMYLSRQNGTLNESWENKKGADNSLVSMVTYSRLLRKQSRVSTLTVAQKVTIG